ncbi:PilZ domain-containing protein [Roseomonas sp. GC11]|uniref:PilZ domain-containing protein n=1 Tax=Roseomonas sp. GC11 TaxID=2950546 RepID=UPI00210CF357|nr:PilZ domain-containing protein [Roseomonas sp. GC11]
MLSLLLAGMGQALAQATPQGTVPPPGAATARPRPTTWMASDTTRLLLMEAESALRLESDATLGILPSAAAMTEGSRLALSQRRAEADAALSALLGAVQAEAAAHPAGVPEGLSARLQLVQAAQQTVTAMRSRIDGAARGGVAPSTVEWDEAVVRRTEALRQLAQAISGYRPLPSPLAAPPPPTRTDGNQAEVSIATAGKSTGPASGETSETIGKRELGEKQQRQEKKEAKSEEALHYGFWIAKGAAVLAVVVLIWRNRRRERTDNGRQTRRVQVDMPVKLEGHHIDPDTTARITNVSLGGAALVVEGLHLRKGSILTIECGMLGTVQAETVHSGGGTLRVRFRDLNNAQVLTLERLTAPPPEEAEMPNRRRGPRRTIPAFAINPGAPTSEETPAPSQQGASS